jgi:hypothetical protein
MNWLFVLEKHLTNKNMELERKVDEVFRKIRPGSLDPFNSLLQTKLYEFYRDEFKLKFLNEVTKRIQEEIVNHNPDGSCRYSDDKCPTLKQYQTALFYLEQEYDRIVDDINLYGTLNRHNAHVFGEQFSTSEKEHISNGIDKLLSGQVLLGEGQLQLSEDFSNRLDELKDLLLVLNKNHWTNNFRGQIQSAIIGLGINSENVEFFMTSIEKSIGI